MSVNHDVNLGAQVTGVYNNSRATRLHILQKAKDGQNETKDSLQVYFLELSNLNIREVS